MSSLEFNKGRRNKPWVVSVPLRIVMAESWNHCFITYPQKPLNSGQYRHVGMPHINENSGLSLQGWPKNCTGREARDQ